jgi:methionyl-tRNA formyltransferase
MRAAGIERRVRGFQPFPTSYTFHDGKRLTIWNSSVVAEYGSAAEGSIVEASGDNLVVACGHESALAILEIQPEGKRRMQTRDFLNGVKLRIGDRIDSGRVETEAANR